MVGQVNQKKSCRPDCMALCQDLCPHSNIKVPLKASELSSNGSYIGGHAFFGRGSRHSKSFQMPTEMMIRTQRRDATALPWLPFWACISHSSSDTRGSISRSLGCTETSWCLLPLFFPTLTWRSRHLVTTSRRCFSDASLYSSRPCAIRAAAM